MNRKLFREIAIYLAMTWYVLANFLTASAADLPWGSLQITNQAGQLSLPFAADDRLATVLVFVAPDCPISNQYVDFGEKRPQATRHDLELVLEALVKGDEIDATETKAVGCYIDRQKDK